MFVVNTKEHKNWVNKFLFMVKWSEQYKIFLKLTSQVIQIILLLSKEVFKEREQSYGSGLWYCKKRWLKKKGQSRISK